MTANSLLISARNIDFLLYDWLDTQALFTRPRFEGHTRDVVDSFLDLAHTVAQERFEPLARLLDDQAPYIEQGGEVWHPDELRGALKAYTAAGLPAALFPEEVGGPQLPYSVVQAVFLPFQAASIGASAYPLLGAGAANLMLRYASASQIQRYAQPIIDGTWYGTMALSEPGVGSSLGDLRTKAVLRPDGTFRLFGSKMWISGGDHSLSENIIHMVLARSTDAPGTKGLSLFIVPKVLVEDDGALGERNDVALVGLNHKMGGRANTNTLLSFGDGSFTPGGEPGAVGYLVGEEGQGLAAMFAMMNEARISVGASSVALGYAGYLRALEYARTRTQGRAAGERDLSTPMVPIVEHTDVRRMLLAQKAYVEGGLALVLYCGRLIDEQDTGDFESAARAALLLEVLTPITKSWPAQWCLVANDLAIQIHGGAGYTTDHLVEMLYRDARINDIFEGTRGIQGLDLLGRKVLMDDQAGLRLLLATMRETIATAQAAGGAAAGYAAQLAAAVDRLEDVTTQVWAPGDRDLALANATLYLEAAGHVVVAWLWLDQLLVVQGDDGFARGKRAATQYFFAYELPKTSPTFDLLSTLDRTALDLDPGDLE